MPNKPRVIRNHNSLYHDQMRYYMDEAGWMVPEPDPGMMSPVRCTHCRAVYDLGEVEPTGRYTDCTLWTSPCCHRQVDDRVWKSRPDIKKLY